MVVVDLEEAEVTVVEEGVVAEVAVEEVVAVETERDSPNVNGENQFRRRSAVSRSQTVATESEAARSVA